MSERVEQIVLVLADPEDIHADAVIAHLHELDRKVVRLHVGDLWPRHSALTWSIDTNGMSANLCWKGRQIAANEVGAVFCRDFNFARCRAEASIEDHLVHAEARAALYGFFRGMEGVYWINPPWYDEMADNKPYQYACARDLGLLVPRTMVTNRPEDLVKFHAECRGEIIVKQLSEVCLVDAESTRAENDIRAYGFFTNVVELRHLNNLAEIMVTPCLFQEHIRKQADIRVTVVGGEVFAAMIDSQGDERTRTDFRHNPHLPVRRFELPGDVQQKLLALLKRWRIQFAACDFALSEQGELVFLEANVVGNWLWIEGALGMPVSKTIAMQLDAACRKRNQS